MVEEEGAVERTRGAAVVVVEEEEKVVGFERREVEAASEEEEEGLGAPVVVEPEMEERTAVGVGRVADAGPLVGARVEEASEERRGARVVPVVVVEEGGAPVVGLRRGARTVLVLERGFFTPAPAPAPVPAPTLLPVVIEVGAFLRVEVAGGGVDAEGCSDCAGAERVAKGVSGLECVELYSVATILPCALVGGAEL